MFNKPRANRGQRGGQFVVKLLYGYNNIIIYDDGEIGMHHACFIRVLFLIFTYLFNIDTDKRLSSYQKLFVIDLCLLWKLQCIGQSMSSDTEGRRCFDLQPSIRHGINTI